MGQQVTYLADNERAYIPWPFYQQRNQEGKVMVNKAVKFKDGMIKFDSEKDADVIKMLDNHVGNKANGGKTFKKQSLEVDALVEVNNGNTFAAMPEDGLQQSDIEALEYLAKLKASIPPNIIKKVVALAEGVHSRFSLAGVPVPADSIGAARLRARVIEMLGTLEERGIWSYGDTKGQKHSGQGTAEDKEL